MKKLRFIEYLFEYDWYNKETGVDEKRQVVVYATKEDEAKETFKNWFTYRHEWKILESGVLKETKKVDGRNKKHYEYVKSVYEKQLEFMENYKWRKQN